MPNWRKVIVGDAFKLPSCDFNYYRDLALVWPFLMFSVVSVLKSFDRSLSPAEIHYFHRALAAALVCLLLAKERLLLIAGALAFFVSRGLFALIWYKEWPALVTLLLGLAAFTAVVFAKARDGWRPSYQIPKGFTIVELLIGLASLIATLTVAQWMQGWPLN